MANAVRIRDEYQRGRLSKADISYIKDNVGKASLRVISTKLNRDPETIKQWIVENLGVKTNECTVETIPVAEAAVRKDLRNSPDWKQLRREFIDEELEYFEFKYGKMMAQFKNDITPTEETEIFLLVKYEILMNRNLAERKDALVDVQRLEKTIAIAYDNGDATSTDATIRENLVSMEQQLIAARAAQGQKTTEFVKLTEKHSNILKELKGTRDQRISRIENSKQTFVGFLKALQDEKLRQAEGRDMELMRVAGDVEFERLGQPHRYVDGTLDLPLLSEETLALGDGKTNVDDDERPPIDS